MSDIEILLDDADALVVTTVEPISVTVDSETVEVTLDDAAIVITVVGAVPGIDGADGADGADGGILAVREVTAAGAVTFDVDDDDIVLVNKTVGEATVVNLPASAGRTAYRFVKIVDAKLDSDANPITITPFGAETILGLTTYVINFSGGSLELWPLPGGTGWYV